MHIYLDISSTALCQCLWICPSVIFVWLDVLHCLYVCSYVCEFVCVCVCVCVCVGCACVFVNVCLSLVSSECDLYVNEWQEPVYTCPSASRNECEKRGKRKVSDERMQCEWLKVNRDSWWMREKEKERECKERGTNDERGRRRRKMKEKEVLHRSYRGTICVCEEVVKCILGNLTTMESLTNVVPCSPFEITVVIRFDVRVNWSSDSSCTTNTNLSWAWWSIATNSMF